jgi:hypothetical protein
VAVCYDVRLISVIAANGYVVHAINGYGFSAIDQCKAHQLAVAGADSPASFCGARSEVKARVCASDQFTIQCDVLSASVDDHRVDDIW